MVQARRDACDSCHFRKIRCWSTTQGICYPCQSHGRTCVFGNRKAMGRPRKVKKPDPPGPLTPTSRRSSMSSPKGNSSSARASKPSPSSIWPGDASENLGLDFGEAVFNKALECPIFDPLSDEMLPSPSRTESFSQAFDGRNELPTPSGNAGSSSPLERKTTEQEPQHTPSGLFPAVQKESPPSDIVSLVDQALCTNRRAFDIHSQLSGILFDLRQQSLGCLTLMQQGILTGLDRTYMCVAALCEAIHSLQDLLQQQCGLADYEHPYALEAQLTFLAVTTVLDIYENYYSRFVALSRYHENYQEQRNNDIDHRLELDKSNFDRERIADPNCISPSVTSQYPPGGSISQRLGQLVHLTVMDFHLGQLQCIFQPSCLPPASEGFTCEKYETNKSRLKSLRESLQADIQVVKRGI